MLQIWLMMTKKSLDKLVQKWEKKLKKEGLPAFDSGRIIRPDRITYIINTEESGLANFLNKLDFWESLQHYYWNYYPKKRKALELYIMGYKHSEICKKLHLKYYHIAYLIRCLRRDFKKYNQISSKNTRNSEQS